MAFRKLGITSFGGPIAHIGYFRGEFVVRRRWLDEAAYADVVGLCQFLPGPASSQVVFTLGLMRAGYCGALAAWTGLRLILASCPRISFGEERSRVAWSNSISAIFGLHPLCSSSPAMDFLWAVVLLVPFDAYVDPAPPIAADPERQAEVSERGAQVMPFKLSTTTHIFTKTSAGALQKVIVKDPNDTAQIGLIRRHLSDFADRFSRRDFSGPTEVHGAQMPGLADLKKAKPAEISVGYQDLAEGAQIEYSAQKANLIAALHKWVDAQLSDHGPDAHEGHMQHHDHAV